MMVNRRTTSFLAGCALAQASASLAWADSAAGNGWPRVQAEQQALSCPASQTPAQFPLPETIVHRLKAPGQTNCEKLEAIDLVGKALTSPQSQIRYLMVRALYGAVHSNVSNPSAALQPLLALTTSEGSWPADLVVNDLYGKLRLDHGHIGDYAALILGMPRTTGDLMSFSVSELEVPGVAHVGEVCYHAQLNRVNISDSVWRFTTVTRFCNMKQVVARSTVFETPFYSQTIQDSDFRGARIKLGLVNGSPSEARFIDTDLRGASFEGEMTDIEFTNCKLTGAVINGKTCSDDAGSDCLD